MVCSTKALEVARFRRAPVDHGAPADLARVDTPDAHTIDALTEQLGVAADQIAKHVLLTGRTAEGEPRLVVAIVRGDMDVNPVVAARLSGVGELVPAEAEAIRSAGLEPGFASAVGLANAQRDAITVVADELIEAQTNWVVGANEVDVHLTGAQVGRDFTLDATGALALPPEGALDESSGEPLTFVRGVEVGNIFQLGRRYTDAVGATWLDEQGRPRSFVMGSYGIGVGRLLACLAEHHHDEHGLAWPPAVAPYDVQIVAIGKGDAARTAAGTLAEALRQAGVDVLVDDRDIGAGVKLTDADLRGLPLRVVVGQRGLDRGVVELKRRLATWDHAGPGTTAPGEVREVAHDVAVSAVLAELEALRG